MFIPKKSGLLAGFFVFGENMEIVKGIFRANFFTTGLAMFAMFFGSGNLVFPVGIGKMVGEEVAWAIFGLFITAVLIPFSTLCLMLLFNGDYDQFFSKIGVVPGKIVAFTTLLLIGPFGVLPRCIAFSYSTFSIYFSSISLPIYAVISCVLIFILTVKENDVVGILGNFLTPILLFSLAMMIVKGLMMETIPDTSLVHAGPLSTIKLGFLEGYKTFDIFAALFFSGAIIPAFRNVLGDKLDQCQGSLMKLAIKSSLVGMAILLVVYGGLGLIAARFGGALIDIPPEKLLGHIANIVMGKTAGLVANSIVSLACLTTAISLALVSAKFIKREIFRERVSYLSSLLLTMVISLVFSLLGFNGIMRMVMPLLMVMCPSVITLVMMNALNYFFGFKYVRTPVYAVFFISLMVLLCC